MEVEIKEIDPICPHCEEELTVVYVNPKVRVPGFWARDYGQVYICPHCRKTLGFADWSS